MKDNLFKYVARLMFILTAALFVLAAWEWIAQLFDYRLTWISYGPGRLLELAAMVAIVWAAFLLHQIRDALRSK